MNEINKLQFIQVKEKVFVDKIKNNIWINIWDKKKTFNDNFL